MQYSESEQKRILREMERDLLALVAVEQKSGKYEVLYSDGAYREYENCYQGADFYAQWESRGLPLVHPDDREAMRGLLSRENVARKFSSAESLSYVCRLLTRKGYAYARINAVRDAAEKGVFVVSIRNIDREMRQTQQKAEEMRDLEDRLLRMRLKSFISQTHPHFLYNALSSIREIVLQDPGYGAQLLYDFTTHLRAGIRAVSSGPPVFPLMLAPLGGAFAAALLFTRRKKR